MALITSGYAGPAGRGDVPGAGVAGELPRTRPAGGRLSFPTLPAAASPRLLLLPLLLLLLLLLLPLPLLLLILLLLVLLLLRLPANAREEASSSR